MPLSKREMCPVVQVRGVYGVCEESGRRWQNLLPGMCKAIWNPLCILPCDNGLVSHSSRAMLSTKIGSREKGGGVQITLLHKYVECTALL